MQNNNPLSKVVFIQKIAAYTKTSSLKDLFQLAYLSNSWNDTIKNYSFHLFEMQLKNIESDDTLEDMCHFVIMYDMIWFGRVILLSETVIDRFNLLRLFCKQSPSLDMAQLVFDKLFERGGNELLRRLFTAVEKDDVRRLTVLMLGCHHLASPTFMKFFFDKMVEVGGNDLLRSQLEMADNDGWTPLIHCIIYSAPTEVLQVVFDKLVQVGGNDFLKHQLTAKSTEHLSNTPIMFACSWSSSTANLKLILEKIIEVGGTELLHLQLCAINSVGGRVLGLACFNSASPTMAKFVSAVLFHCDLFKKMYANLTDYDQRDLRRKAGIDSASWVPDRESAAEVKTIFKKIENQQW